MAEPYMAFTQPTARRIVDAVRTVEATPIDLSGVDLAVARRPRYYRAFELTAALSGEEGATAAVKWLAWSAVNGEYSDSGDTGVVTDTLGVCWGLEGDRGVAAWRGMANAAPIWEIVQNPGKPILFGTLDADTTSSPTNVTAGSATISAVLRMLPATGKKYAKNTGVYLGHTPSGWEIISVLSCTVSV